MRVLLSLAASTIRRRDPDFIIGGRADRYLERWFVIPRNPLFNIYLHRFWRSDDDRALHDHPWWNLSLILSGGYVEHTIAAGGVNHRVERRSGAWAFRLGRAAHRIELLPGLEGQTITLFITGPRFREWGFHCPDAGWRHWRDFTGEDSGEIGWGCGEP